MGFSIWMGSLGVWMLHWTVAGNGFQDEMSGWGKEMRNQDWDLDVDTHLYSAQDVVSRFGSRIGIRIRYQDVDTHLAQRADEPGLPGIIFSVLLFFDLYRSPFF